ncbi:hypothetical protein KPL78_00500 [Roseomonas sp. HJA6]|uniref:Uracil-DNA glycosylase-like domain-containing protein n=1 Tax=Roseomonas alba TaxID=2846776 RepID=A0ABS7A1W7_9PROT|nr:hypothetical protein [Neoroseomonas alba]MBW6396299.1 hypothetical protein [Neoroseomonas alba]
MNDTEALRLSFRPERVRMLMVGESAPAGGTFFYRANSNAYREIRKAFGRDGDDGFLAWFKAQGFYLDDLVLTPINTTGRAERQSACEAGIAPLSERIRNYRPQMVIAFKKSICREVLEAVRRSGTGAAYECTHFPGVGQQAKFRADMALILPRLPGRDVNL